MESPIKPMPESTSKPSSSSPTLPENGNGEQEEEQLVPINGFCTEICSEIQLPLLCPAEKCFETSPSPHALPCAENGGETIDSSKHQCLTPKVSAKRPEAGNNGVNKKPLRRSPRFIEATGNAGSGGSIKKFQNCGMIYGGNQLRRSPRFIRATENDGNKQPKSASFIGERGSGAPHPLRKADMVIMNLLFQASLWAKAHG
ncbi:uncharacterized protein LOC110808786 [Carica papaya]|uniref:uncharacterized protein LOC110808786 n=1 Tax=Carica papaya TaxID=3649 RepID=UPI000B8C9B7B|nr:uncharacterized protein LOC110808786 [Carica papaya]